MRKCGGVCIFVKNNIYYTTINMDRYSNEKDIEVCAVKLFFIAYHYYSNCIQIPNW